MNKKLLVIVLVVLALAGLGGYYVYSQNNAKTANIYTQQPTTNDSDVSDEPGVFTSIRDALSKSVSLTCEYSDEAGKLTKTYIKNGAVRVSSTAESPDGAGEVIVKDNQMHIWSDTTKKGFIYKFENTATDTTGQEANPASVIDAIEAYKDNCKVAVVADSYFTPPADVAFQDLSTMFQNLPSGNLPPGIE